VLRKTLIPFALGAALAALGGCSPPPETILRLDFGNDFGAVAEGFQPVSRVYRSPRYLWVSSVRDGDRPRHPDPLMKDSAWGTAGEFWIGLDNAVYQVTLIMGDPEQAHGPFTVFAQGQAVQRDVLLNPGETRRPRFPVTVTGGKLALRFEAAPEATFVVNGLIVEGPRGSAPRRLFPGAPPDELPTAEEVRRSGRDDSRQALRDLCEWLMAKRLPNGFLGDYEPGAGKQINYWWYTSAYPIRVLLAGYQLFNEPRYLAAVTAILDKLVEEQLPNGAWAQAFLDRPVRTLPPTEIEGIYQRYWLNMADVGSIAGALAVSCRYVDPARKRRYLGAAKRYADDWAAQWQLPSGAFTNGLLRGVPQDNPYHVATATEAAFFAALSAVSGEARYLRIAQRAAEFLLDNWREDGRPFCYPDKSFNDGVPYVQPVTQFGDIFYLHDGLLFVWNQTRDQAFRDKMRRVYDWHLEGEYGLLQAMAGQSWFPLQDMWDNSKTAGMPLVFLARDRMAGDGKHRGRIADLRRFLATPEFARRIGVMLDDPDLPWGGHSLQSWACCSVAATGFGGMTLAEMTEPGIIYLAGKP
jgi:hypothetical protein